MRRTPSLALVFVLFVAPMGFAGQRATPGGPHSHGAGAGPHFVDADGDGICDLYQRHGVARRGQGTGPQDGAPHRGVGPMDGSGFGAGRGNGAGICDGSARGPQGQGHGRGAGQHRGGRR
jgi:hypothetical protein